MEIHIIPCVLGERKEEEDLGRIDKYIERKVYNEFDSVRQISDSDFIFSEEIEWLWIFDDPDDKNSEFGYKRPKDIDFAIDWVKRNNPKYNMRLVTLLEAMKKNSNIWLHVSY
jgi:hypothetical protein